MKKWSPSPWVWRLIRIELVLAAVVVAVSHYWSADYSLVVFVVSALFTEFCVVSGKEQELRELQDQVASLEQQTHLLKMKTDPVYAARVRNIESMRDSMMKQMSCSSYGDEP